MRRAVALAILACLTLAGGAHMEVEPATPPEAVLPASDRPGADDVAAAIRAREGQPEPPAAGLAPETRAMADAAFAAYYEYRAQGYQHRHEVFRWQLFSSRIIFGVVIALVALGVYFSWLQFLAGRQVRVEGEGDPGDATHPSTVKLSTSGIEVSSPVLGVIILAISLAFFYLYLVHVYPINEVL